MQGFSGNNPGDYQFASAHPDLGLPGVNALLIQAGSTARTDFQPSPLDPSWVLEGNPTPRGLTLAKADDDNFSCGLWDCNAGKFKFIYYCDEIVHILEGEVIVQEPGGIRTLKPGDVAFFPEGLTTIWTIPAYVRKFCIHRTAPRSFVRRVLSKIKRLLTRRTR